MATKVHMEALSPTMEEGQVVKWLRSEGDAVSQGDILAEIETDKATMELTARGSGVLLKVIVGEGGTAPVGDVIAIIGDEGEDIGEWESADGGGSAAAESSGGATEEDASGAEGSEPPTPEERAEREEPAPAPSAATRPGDRLRASPVARRLAEEAGLDLGRVEGSGPSGRIVKRDVESAIAEGPAPAAATAAPTWSGELPDTEYEDIPLSQMRKTIARRLTESIGPVPHFFLTIEVDMSRVLAARARVNELVEAEGARVSVNDFVLKATAAALKRHPECNAAWMETAVRRFNVVHVGVAVAVEDGLITPVVRHADRKGLVQIGREVKEMAGRAREKKLQPDEYTGATFSVSNLGMFGIQEFTAVINPPEAGILAVGRVEEKPVVVDGELEVQPRMRITMSCDHRVIDGATGARFLQTLQAMLEEPTAILV